ncbi:hypothetical protein LPJ64_005538 [Coemansia asiatica]|uniref:BRCA1-associated protein n=1 Tax=Coemansia asiatica TaxID=1052880 RepID=A0A9W7XGZ5_9FUNG|nr:hypothetical protein LPJ64_005538 [Coemansia asiatica]
MDGLNQQRQQKLETFNAKTRKPSLRGVFETCVEWSSDGRRAGVLRLFRNKEQEDEAESKAVVVSEDLETDGENTRVIGVVGVPGYMTPTDFLSFAGVLRDSIEHMRVVGDARSANHYMVLLRLRSAAQAEKFHSMFNGKTFSPLEPETCDVVFIGLAECDATDVEREDGSTSIAAAAGSVRVFVEPEDVFASAAGTSCAVCLEALDDGAAGLLTILCQHSFHAQCLAQWGDGTCPVCRYSQTAPFVDHEQFERTVATQAPENPAGVSHCYACERTDDLWICLICGSIGCGRYANAHAKDHFDRTSHPYSMKLESQVVWDYVGDGYVHRLLQGMGDGKLVAMETPARPASAAAVMETASLSARGKHDDQQEPLSEDALLLAAQLESQKVHYEEQIAELNRRHAQDIQQLSKSEASRQALQKQVDALQKHNRELKEQADFAAKESQELRAVLESERNEFAAERSRLEGSIAQWIKKSNKDAEVLKEEKAMTRHLLENQEDLKTQIARMNEQTRDLTEQIRDLSFYISTQQAINAEGGSSGQSEIQGASIVGVAQPPASNAAKTKGKRRIPRK